MLGEKLITTLIVIAALLGIAAIADALRTGKLSSVRRFLSCLAVTLLVGGGIALVIGYRFVAAYDVLKNGAARGDMAAHAAALKLYRDDVAAGQYPAALPQLVFDDAPGWNGPYLATITADPWGNRYQYQSDGSTFTITSVHNPPGFHVTTQTETITRVDSDTTAAADYD